MFANKQRLQEWYHNLKRFSGLQATSQYASRCLLVGSLISTAAGCSNIEPWIKPYERQNLADPIMLQSRHGIATSYLHHVYQSREGARGAEGGSGGGCGCN